MITLTGLLRSIDDVRQQLWDTLSAMTDWRFAGEGSRSDLHKLGADLTSMRLRIARMRSDEQFPSFSGRPDSLHPAEAADRVRRRRELIVMVHSLPPSNLEIFEWLASGKDKEAALLYAYSRGSVSEPSPGLKAEFFSGVNAMIRKDPALGHILDVEALLNAADSKYSECQAAAYAQLV